MKELPPLPNVGDFITKDFGPTNTNTWRRPGEVRAIVDNHIVVRCWLDGFGEFYILITPEDWTYGAEVWRIVTPPPADPPLTDPPDEPAPQARARR